MKKVLITGAHGGLGAALVNEYQQNGWSVLAVDHDPNCQDAQFIDCDFTDATAVDALCDVVKNETAIDTLICNAAYYHFSAMTSITPQQLQDAWMVNLVAHFRLLQTMVQHQTGLQRVVVVGSDQCFEAMDYNIAYAMAKAALVQMVKSYAAEYDAPHMFCVCPGTLKDTPITIEAAQGVSKINGLSVTENLAIFDAESPTGHCIEPKDLAAWIFALEHDNPYPSGTVKFMPSL